MSNDYISLSSIKMCQVKKVCNQALIFNGLDGEWGRKQDHLTNQSVNNNSNCLFSQDGVNIQKNLKKKEKTLSIQLRTENNT